MIAVGLHRSVPNSQCKNGQIAVRGLSLEGDSLRPERRGAASTRTVPVRVHAGSRYYSASSIRQAAMVSMTENTMITSTCFSNLVRLEGRSLEGTYGL